MNWLILHKIVHVHCISQINIVNCLVLVSLNLFSNWQDFDTQIFFFFFGISYIKTHKLNRSWKIMINIRLKLV